jgi:hypothetical protein
MTNSNPRTRQPGNDRLHPLVYLALGFAALWFAVAAWGFAGERYTDYLLVIVSGFALVAVAIPVVLWRTGTRHGRSPDQSDRSCPTFRDWIKGDFVTWQDRSKGSNAAIEVLLPLGAIAIGMTAIAIVFAVTAHAA